MTIEETIKLLNKVSGEITDVELDFRVSPKQPPSYREFIGYLRIATPISISMLEIDSNNANENSIKSILTIRLEEAYIKTIKFAKEQLDK